MRVCVFHAYTGLWTDERKKEEQARESESR